MSVPSVASKSWKVVRYHASSYTDGNAKLDRAWKQQQLLSTSSTSSSSSPSSSLVACYNGGNVTLLDLSTGHIARTIQAEADDEFVTFTLSPTQQLLATLSRRTSQLTLHSTSDASTVTSVRLSAYHSLPISSLAFDPSARYIVTASHDRTLRIFDLHHTPAPQLVHTLRGHSQPITLATFHPAARRLQLVSGDDSGQLRVWSLATGDCQTLSSEHLAAITCITFTSGSSSSGGNSDGHMITAGRDKVICVWDVKHAYKCIRTITAFETVDSLLPWPLSAAVPQAEEGKKAEKKRPTVVFVSGGEKGLLRWWDGETGKELYQYALPSLLNTAATAASAPTSTSPSAADKFIANQIAHLLLLPLSPPPAEPSSSIAATAPFHVIAVTREQNFHVFAPLPTLTPVTLYVGHNDEIIDLRFIPTLNDSSSPQAVVVTNSPQPRVFDLTTLSASLLSGHSDVVLAVDVSTDGRFITTASKDRTVRVWTPAVGKPGGGWKCVAVCEGHTESVGAVGVSKSGKGSSGKLFVVSGARDRTLKMWDAAALSKLTGEGKEGKDDQAEIVSLSCVSTRVAHEKDINSIAVSPNDKLIASGSEDRTIHLFSTAASSASSTTTTTTTATLTSVATLKGHRRGVWSLRFSPVDRVLASASGDKTIRIWSLVDYTCVKVLEGHNGSVKTLSWLRGGLHVVSGGDDGLLKCWLVKTSECVGTWTVPVHETGGEVGTEAGEEDETVGEKVWALDVSADGRMLLTGGVASVLNVWQDVTEEEAEERRTEQSVQLGREQRLANAIRRKEWKEAMDIALSLKQPRRLHTVLVEVLKEGRQGDDGGEAKIAELVCALDEERMDVLLTYVRDWNSNSKTAMVANVVLQLLFKHFPLSTLQKKKLLTDSLPGMVLYCDRHFQRIDRLLQRSYLIDYTLDAMNLLLPEHERESDELFDASVSVKQEPLLAAEAKDQLLQQPMDEEKEALGQDDDKDEEEPGVLLSLSQLPSAPGGPGRSRILALDKLTELGASEGPAGKEEEKEAAEDEESEWQSNWQSPAAAVHTSRHKPTSTATAAHQRATTPQRRKKVLVEHEEGTEDGQLEERDPRVEASQRTEVVERRQSLRTPSRAKVSIKQQQRADGGSGKQREAVESSMKKRMKSK